MSDDKPKTAPYELRQHVSPSALSLKPYSKIAGVISDRAPALSLDAKLELTNEAVPESNYEQAEVFHTAYRDQEHARLGALRKIYEDLGSPNNLIVMVFCKKYFPLFKNWIISCERNGIIVKNKLLVFCLDKEAELMTKKLGVSHYFLDPELYVKAGEAHGFADKKFGSTMLYKNAVISDCLKLGPAILFQDSDLVWFKDPFNHLESHGQHYDVQFMFDGIHRRFQPLYCNSGFIYINPTDASKALFETALRNSASILKTCAHQFSLGRILNHFLQHQLIRLHILPEHLFMNGHLINTNGGVKQTAKRWKTDAIVFHYSWSYNIEQKFEKISKYGMCYLEKNEISGLLNNQSTSQNMKSIETNVTLYLNGQDPLEIACYDTDPILKDLFQALQSGNQPDNNSLVHLQIMEGEDIADIFFKSCDLRMIKTIPALDFKKTNYFKP